MAAGADSIIGENTARVPQSAGDRIARRLKRLIKATWYLRSRIPILNFPVLWKLPYGSYFLAYGDVAGLIALSLDLMKNPPEAKVLKFVERYLSCGMVVLDVGAHQGLYTLLAATRVGEAGRVVAFEPAVPHFSKLKTNVRLNRYSQVILEQIAVGDATGDTDFYICLGHQGGLSSRRHPTADDLVVDTKLVKTPLTSLDLYLHQHKIECVDFVKIDVEGGELEVLRGAERMLSSSARPVVLCEAEDIRTQSWGYRAKEIPNLLLRYGFTIYSVTSEGLLRRASDPAVLESTDVVAVPPEKQDVVANLLVSN